jgi:enoyl-CoA hydratase/carnithine racemase
MDFATIAVSATGSRGAIRLDRPDKLNPLSPRTLVELAEAARWFDGQREVKVVVVSGAGRAFSAGADIAAFATAEAGEGSLPAREGADLGRLMAEAIEGMRAITVARVHGHCVGGGVVLVSACDLRLAADDARFSIPEVALGIPLTWGGIPRLVREIGPAMTRELVLTCRPFDAAEAKAIGFVNRVVPAEQLDAAVDELVDVLESRSAFTLEATKRRVDAVTETMVGTSGAWADADSLVTARRDPESRAAAAAYLDGLARRRS